RSSTGATAPLLCRPRRPEEGLLCGVRIHEHDRSKRREYEVRRFRQVRTETLMRVALGAEVTGAPRWPDGISVRVMDLDVDLEDYAIAYGEAFRDHWGHVELPLEQRIRRKRAEFESWGDEFVPDLWFVATDGDTIVGSVGSFPCHGGDATRSYLYHVFVRAAWRNRGIATALLRHTFAQLHERGCQTVELHVDSKNLTHGLQLYRGVGMRPVWHQDLYERHLALAVDS
ncbi:MAG: GNAT family N-acetyltransferase, partial [Candidatus Bipolaricaulota bacterium]